MNTASFALLCLSVFINSTFGLSDAQEVLEKDDGTDVTMRNLDDYPVCLIDEDCHEVGDKKGKEYRCFQYMCYPWQEEEEEDFMKCQVKEDCKGMRTGEDGDCFRHHDRKKVLSGICLSQSETTTCSEHSECEASLRCVNGHCGDQRYFDALASQQCVDDSLCRDLLLGDLCCYDVSSSPDTWRGGERSHNLSRKCCANEHDTPVIPPPETVAHHHVQMIDQVLSKLEEFEITKIYCLVFSNDMRDKMPSCNQSGGMALTTSLRVLVTLAFMACIL